MLAQLLTDLVSINEEIGQCQENLSECGAEARWSGEIDYSTDYWQDKFSRMSQLRWERGIISKAIEIIAPTNIMIPCAEYPQEDFNPLPYPF